MTQLDDHAVVTEAEALVASALGADATIDPGAALEAAPPKISLLTSATDITDLLTAKYAENWVNGITFEPEGGALSLTDDYPYFWSCPEEGGAAWSAESPGDGKPIPTAPEAVEYRPYVAHAADPCVTTFGMFGRDGRGRAKRLLTANLPRIMENELWTGDRADAANFPNDYFDNAPTVLNSGTARGYISAFVELEQAIFALDNRPGMIHAEPRLVQLWLRNSFVNVVPSGRRIESSLGTVVVPGTGYPGTRTGGTAVGNTRSYAYGTGPVVVARTPVRDMEGESVNWDTNTRNVRAEAFVAAFWDSKVKVAMLVDLINELS